ncbi:MAG: M48 family metallopeptidase [Saccharospirillum sp.]|nr:M48 family metallopeptidase [Saccharospirillum sp.]
MAEQLEWQGESIPIVRSRRKTLALHVKAGEAEIRAPGHLSRTDIRQFLDSRQQWLLKVKTEQAQRQADLPDYSQNETAPLMDRQLELSLTEGSALAWKVEDNQLHITVKERTRDAVHTVLADFYKAQARFYLTEKTLQCVHQQGWHQRLTDIRFRRTKTKWGHCTAAGRIQYNWLVMQAPERVVDYLVAHECAHLLHPHHGPAFWAEVQRLHPGWQAERAWLHHQGHRLQL